MSWLTPLACSKDCAKQPGHQATVTVTARESLIAETPPQLQSRHIWPASHEAGATEALALFLDQVFTGSR
jgi:hypothetical protein